MLVCACVCTRVHMCVCLHTCVHVCVRAHACVRRCARVHVHAHVCVHVHTRVHTCAYACACVRMCAGTCGCFCVCVWMCVHVCAHMCARVFPSMGLGFSLLLASHSLLTYNTEDASLTGGREKGSVCDLHWSWLAPSPCPCPSPPDRGRHIRSIKRKQPQFAKPGPLPDPLKLCDKLKNSVPQASGRLGGG